MKVICAGASKTGTKSIAKALRILGYNAVYDFEEAIEFAFKEWEDVWNGRQQDLKLLMETVYSNKVEAVVDMPHTRFFDEFLKQWPNAKVILMLRDEEKWYQSFKNMHERSYKSYGYAIWLQYLSPSMYRLINWNKMLFKITTGTMKPHACLWKSWYRQHNSYVRSIVPKSQLLEYDVTEGWEPLCEFLNKPVPAEIFPLENRAGDGNNVEDRLMRETWIAKKARRELLIVLIFFPLILAILFSYYFSCM